MNRLMNGLLISFGDEPPPGAAAAASMGALILSLSLSLSLVSFILPSLDAIPKER